MSPLRPNAVCGAALFAMLLVPSAGAAPFVKPRDPQCVAYSPDGQLVATGKSGPSSGVVPPAPHNDPRRCGVVQIWDVASGKALVRMETFGDLTQVAFSPDGKLVAASRLFTAGEGLQLNEVRVWDASTGKTVHRFDRCHGFAFSPDGRRIALAARRRCVLFDLATGQRLKAIAPLGDPVSAVYAPDGKSLLAIVQAGGKFLIRRCDATSGKLLDESPPFDQPFYTLAVSPDGQRLASGHDAQVLLWETAGLKPVARLATDAPGIAHPFYSADGKLLAAGGQADATVVIWEAATGQELRRYRFGEGSFRPLYPRGDQERVRPETDPARFVFSPDGESFLTGAYGGIIRQVSDGRDTRRFGD